MMPPLPNQRHELFAQALAGGKSASAAYRSAGYKCAPHKARGHGHRLRTREDIAARIHELIDKPQNRIATQQIVEAIRTGRPTIYRPELATLARKLALLGATDQEMADALGVDQGTLDRWKTRHKEFRIAIQHGKIRADAEIAGKPLQSCPRHVGACGQDLPRYARRWPGHRAVSGASAARCRGGPVKPGLHRIEDVFVFPALDPLQLVWGTSGLEGTGEAGGQMAVIVDVLPAI